MQIIRQHAYGGPDVLTLEDLDLPEPGPGEVRVRVHAAAVGFYDISNRRGDFAAREYYRKEAVLPIAPGYQGAGTVEALGPEVTTVQVGDRVAWAAGNGSYATHLNMAARQLIALPDDIGLEPVAGALVQGFVSWQLTHRAFPLQPGQTALVTAAAGGMGSIITQLARLRGARVIGAVSTEEKAVVAKEAGADEVVVTGGVAGDPAARAAEVAAEVRRHTGGRGVDVVFDGIGKDAFDLSLDSLAKRGTLVVYGQSSGFVPPFDLMDLQDKGGLYLTRFAIEHYVDRGWPDPEYNELLFSWLRSGDLDIRIDRRYPLAAAAEAHRAVESRASRGRVLLLPHL
jgi:NADPH2:quinone reductase